MTITGQEVVDYAVAIGTGCPYVLGTVGPYSYDCSGLVLAVFSHFGLANLPHEAGLQAEWLAINGTQISIQRASVTPGAILAINVGPSGVGANGNHIAFCKSPGISFEARSTYYGIGSWPLSDHNWTGAYLIPNVNYSSEDTLFTPTVIPANAQADGNGRFPYYRLVQLGGTWHVHAFNGAKFAPGASGLIGVDDVALPSNLNAPPVGMAESGPYIVVVAEDGGTFAYPKG